MSDRLSIVLSLILILAGTLCSETLYEVEITGQGQAEVLEVARSVPDLSMLSIDLDSLVDLVRQDSIESYVYHLEAYNGRFVGTASNYASCEWLAGKLIEFGYDSVVVDTFWINLTYPVRCQNVVAYKVGNTYPDHHVIVGAHRDTNDGSPGADDNGSGVAGVLEMARILKDIDTKMTFVFALWDDEESGGLGSAMYAARASQHCDSIVLYVNLDMIGHYENDTCAIVYYGNDLSYATLWAQLGDSLSGVNINYTQLEPSAGESDDYIFFEYGYPSIFVFEYICSTVFGSCHDSTTYLNFDYLTRMVKASLATLWVAGDTYVPAPRLVMNLVADEPQAIVPNQPDTVELVIESYAGGILVPESGWMHYSVNEGPEEQSLLVQVESDKYEATIPALNCGDRISYYFSIEEASTGNITYPEYSLQNEVALAGWVEFEDDFEEYKGWTVSGDAENGQWIRRQQVSFGTYEDVPLDYDGSGMCYVTGYDFMEDIDNGTTILRSPVLELSVGDPLLSFALWYTNSNSNDVFSIYVSNSDSSPWTLVKSVTSTGELMHRWEKHHFWLNDYVSPTDQVRVWFVASDLGADSHVEAAVDAISVQQYTCLPAPTIITNTLPSWTVSVEYLQQLDLTGGYGTIIWEDKYGDLSGTGMNLSSTGLLSGMPILTGALSFTAVVSDEILRTDERLFSMEINPAVQVTTEMLPVAKKEETYSYQLESTGGTGTKAWSDKNDDLTAMGLNLSSDGLIRGTPADTGNFPFIALVSDAIGATGERMLNLTIKLAYICGDTDHSGETTNISDLTYLVDFMFGGGAAPPVMEAADVNSSGGVDISDITCLVEYLFSGGPEPVCL